MKRDPGGRAAGKGTYDLRRYEKIKSKILNLDPNAEFFVNENPRIVGHSKCAGPIRMKATNNAAAFAMHLEQCEGARACR